MCLILDCCAVVVSRRRTLAVRLRCGARERAIWGDRGTLSSMHCLRTVCDCECGVGEYLGERECAVASAEWNVCVGKCAHRCIECACACVVHISRCQECRTCTRTHKQNAAQEYSTGPHADACQGGPTQVGRH